MYLRHKHAERLFQGFAAACGVVRDAAFPATPL
jgi:hypothetical protein